MEKNYAKILGVNIDKVDNKSAFDIIRKYLASERASIIFTPNPEIVMKARKDKDLMEAINEADLVIPDGIGLIYASKIHGLGLTERVTGYDTTIKLLSYANKSRKSIYILGGKPGIGLRAKAEINKKYPHVDVCGVNDGYFTDEEDLAIIDKINENKPDILFVALGCPRQEKWLHKYKKVLNTRLAIGVGGSIDVLAGSVKRAPKFIQKIGFEWLYRALREPKRFVRLMVLPKFMFKVIFSRNFRNG